MNKEDNLLYIYNTIYNDTNDRYNNIINTYFNNIVENGVIDESIYILLIKIFCKISQPDNAFCLLFHSIKNNIKPKLRFFLPLFEYYSHTQNYDIIDSLFCFMIDIYVYPSIDVYIYMLHVILNLKNNTHNVHIFLHRLLKYMNIYTVDINQDFKNILIKILHTHSIEYKECYIEMNPTILNNNEIEKIKKYILNKALTYKKSFKKLDTYLKNNKKIDIIIDGANCGFFLNCRNKNFSIENVLKIYNNSAFKDLHVVIFLNKSRAKELSDDILKSYNIFITPLGINDDLFWLYASIYNNDTYVLTNDLLRDHIVNINNMINNNKFYDDNSDNNSDDINFFLNKNYCIFKKWRDLKQITYSYTGTYIFKFPHNTTNIHYTNDSIYIPLYNHTYIELSIY